jgi:hypothetical protein
VRSWLVLWRPSALGVLHHRPAGSLYTNGRGHFDVKPVAYNKIVTDLWCYSFKPHSAILLLNALDTWSVLSVTWLDTELQIQNYFFPLRHFPLITCSSMTCRYSVDWTDTTVINNTPNYHWRHDTAYTCRLTLLVHYEEWLLYCIRHYLICKANNLRDIVNHLFLGLCPSSLMWIKYKI